MVNQPLGIEGVNISIFYREESDYVKVSLRSVGDHAVNIIASELYNGGGHKNVGTCQFDDDAMMTELPKMLKELIELSKQ